MDRSGIHQSATDWFHVNEMAHEMLANVKTSIGNDHRWDKCKRYFNTYELVSSPRGPSPAEQSVASYTPINRAFFKMIELLQDHESDLTPQHASKVAFLCDAPGGFVEAFLVYRKRRVDRGGWIGKDVLHAISLMEENPHVPGWRIPRELLRNNNVHLHGTSESSNNGDLYQVKNIDDFVEKVGANSCELVTADGGFDFSSDFNSQETASLRLLVSEVYTALRTIAEGGTFLVKIYDICQASTLRLLWHLHCSFSGGLIIDKPCTSRAANSEKFLICRWYARTTRVDKLIESLRISVVRGTGEVPSLGRRRQLPPSWFIRELAMYNIRYITEQARVILNTTSYMRSSATTYYPRLEEQMVAARQWCTQYGMSMTSQFNSHPKPGTVLAIEENGASEENPAQLPSTACDLDGISATHTPARCKSRSPSTTPYRDGVLLPGRKLDGANCVELPGGGLADARLNDVA